MRKGPLAPSRFPTLYSRSSVHRYFERHELAELAHRIEVVVRGDDNGASAIDLGAEGDGFDLGRYPGRNHPRRS